MPRKARVSVEEAVEVIKTFSTHFTTTEYPACTSEVWKEMSKKTDGKWSAHNWYINVREDRRNIISKARADLNIIVPKKVIGCTEADDSLRSEDTSEDENEEQSSFVDSDFAETVGEPLFQFDLKLSEKDWEVIKPTEPRGKRQRLYLTKGEWTNVVAMKLWQQERWPCAISFKRADVKLTEDNTYIIQITGVCISTKCNNKIYAYGEKKVLEAGLTLKIKTREVRNAFHEPVKRQLNGNRRRNVQRELMEKGCKNWQREQALLYMEDGDTVPPFISNGGVLRNAKKEKINKDLDIQKGDGQDVIQTILKMSRTPEFAGVITWTGASPFFVFYYTPAGMNAYKDYCRITKDEATISIDATGSLVKKIDYGDGHFSGHIFLYTIVINFEKTTLPVYQMLSEAHGVDMIEFFLKHWDRAGAPKPKRVVCDYARALLASLCEVYNGCSVKKYVEWSFSIAIKGEPLKSEKPGTIVRVDVSHVTNMICRWKCFKSVRSCIKEFFVRCVALMVDSTSVEEFQEIFILTCAVGLQNYDDNEINFNGAQSTKEARERLENKIAGSQKNLDFEAIEKTSNEDKLASNKKANYGPNEIESDLEKSAEPNSLLVWLTEQRKKAETTTSTGKNLNPFYLPDFVERLFILAKEFPLWTSATISPSIGRPIARASSSHVECYIGHLKTNILKNTPPPMPAHKFLKIHIRAISGDTLLFSSNMILFEQQNRALDKMVQNTNEGERKKIQDVTYGKEDGMEHDISNRSAADLMSQENWRGKASHGKKYVFDSTDDSFPDICEPILSSSRLENNFEMTVEIPESDASVLRNVTSDHNYSRHETFTISPEKQEIEEFSSQSVVEASEYLMAEPSKPLRETAGHSATVADLRKRAHEEVVSAENIPGKKKSKYFEPCPDIRQRNLLTAKTSKPVILPNGSVCDQPVRIEGCKVFVKYTCPFDSLVHILMTGALDNPKYSSILEQSSNETLNFVWTFMNNGVTKQVLYQRAILLKHLGYACVPGPQTSNRIFSYILDGWDSIANVVKKALESYPSVQVTEKCTGCAGSSYAMPCLSPNHKKIALNGFETLESALEFQPVQDGRKCRKCGSDSTIYMTTNTHVLIDLDVRATNKSGINKTGMTCKLTQLPTSISLPKNNETRLQYRLIGVTTFANSHFVAHCRRAIGTWQLFNDMIFKISKSSLTTEVEPHLAVYLLDQ